jgi:signal peptidase II
MKLPPVLRTLIIVVILSSNIGCDQISKRIVRESIGYNEVVSLFRDYFILTKVENTGAFLSLGSSMPEPLKILILTFLPLVVLTLVVIFLLTNKNLSTTSVAGICFVVGGGIGNIYDRLVYGSVTDFLHIDLGLFRTGIFNMADVSIFIGILTVLFEAYVKRGSLHFDSGEDPKE